MLLLYVHCLSCKCLIQGRSQLLKLCNVDDNEWMNEWVWWSGDIPRGNPKCSIKPRPNADLFTINSTRTGLGSNSRLRCGRWAVKSLSYGSGRMRSHGSVAGRGYRLASSNGGAIRYECVDKVVQSSNASVWCAMWISVCPHSSTRRSIISWIKLLSLCVF